jgi:sporulation protein YlmC with PRC-barrel domain
MNLGSELKDFVVIDSLGEKVGHIKDFIVDTTKDEWDVVDVLISKGMMKGKGVFSFDSIEKFDEDEQEINLKEHAEIDDLDEEKFGHDYILMEEIKDKKIFSVDEEEIGKIYDFVIATSLTPWKTIKLLVHPHEHIIKGRRIRLDVDNVSKITDVITVDLSKDKIVEVAEE